MRSRCFFRSQARFLRCPCPWRESHRRLDSAKTLLYLTDNAGEIGFDQIFAEELAKAGLNKADAEQAAKDKDEAQAALEEAKRLREEAEAIRAKAEKELEKAKQDEDKNGEE